MRAAFAMIARVADSSMRRDRALGTSPAMVAVERARRAKANPRRIRRSEGRCGGARRLATSASLRNARAATLREDAEAEIESATIAEDPRDRRGGLGPVPAAVRGGVH